MAGSGSPRGRRGLRASRPGRAPTSCTLVLLDPPYGADLAAPALSALAENGWLGPNAIAVVEHATKETFARPDGLEVLDERRYGAAVFTFIRWLIS